MTESIHPLWILLAAVVTNNILLANFLGMCSFVACSKQIRTAVGLGVAVTFVLACTTPINWLIYYGLLAHPGVLGGRLTFLTYIVFIAVIAAFVQLVEMLVERLSPQLHHALGIFLPLITVNCAILGASLFMVIREYSFVQACAFGLGAGLGWALAIALLAGLTRRMRYSDIPEPFRGVAIAMIVTGVMAMAFMGFAGMR